MSTTKSIVYAFGICTIFLVSWNLPMTLTSCEVNQEESIDKQNKQKVYKGEATYYHNKYHGRKTASGERYNKKAYTAAIRSNKIKVPFGTMVEVKNLKNGKTVRVKVNDRMSNRASAMIDLSRKAAKDIGMIEAGRIKVEVRVIK
ncbi:MAG: septal ring lytic transglycosylase RlpA family protein [Saprospiraceae bacterium]